MWMPSGGITPVNVTYDDMGHAVTWQRGGESEKVDYDVKGQKLMSQLADGSIWRWNYNDQVLGSILAAFVMFAIIHHFGKDVKDSFYFRFHCVII